MSHSSQVEAVFFAALEKATPEARAAYVSAACGGDADVRRQVEKLLVAHHKLGGFLQKPVLEQMSPATAEPGDTLMLNPTTDGIAARNDPAHAQTSAEGAGDHEEGDLDFLQPSTRPDSLGRMGHYEVLEVLGRGAFGIVFRAFDETLQRVVAIKVLAPLLAVTSPARKRFLREARSSARIRHQNIVQVYAVEEQPLPYLVMEFIPGETLQQRLDQIGPLETADVVEIGVQIAEGLAAAHAQGLIHRDIKPTNILLEAGAVLCVKISDFGLARAADDASVTQSGLIAGTPLFMAPEQAQGKTLDHRADLFSLGSVLYTMCSGRPPFRANGTLAVLKRVTEDTPRPIPEIIPEVPQWLCDIIARLHAKSPEDRIASAKEVARLLSQGLMDAKESGRVQTIPASAPTTEWKASPKVVSGTIAEVARPVPVVRPHSRTNRWLVAAVVLLLSGVGLGLTEANGVTNLHSTIIRLFSPEGTLVVEVDDPSVSVKIVGSEIVITGAGLREIRLKPGNYTVEASKDGKFLTRELVTVETNGRKIVRVSREAPPADPIAASADVIAWERSVAAMPATRQVKAVSTRLQWLNPQFDGVVTPTIEADVVTGLAFDTQHVTDISPVRALVRLRTLDIHARGDDVGSLIDLSPLKGMSLTWSNAGENQISDLSPLVGMPLEWLGVWLWRGDDLTPLKGMPLKWLNCGGHGRPLNLAPLAGLPLDYLCINYRQVADLEPLKNLPLSSLECQNTLVNDKSVVPLKDCKNLKYLKLKETRVSAAGIEVLQRGLPNCTIEWQPPSATATAIKSDAWIKDVAGMPADQQVAAVAARLKECNPGFDGQMHHRIESGVVTEIGLGPDVSDISPLRALVGLKSFYCNQLPGGRILSDLSPLKEMKLTSLVLLFTPVADLSSLKGLNLTTLSLYGSPVSDLSPLADLKLTELDCSVSNVSDLSPLKNIKTLKLLSVFQTQVTDLSPLADLKLTSLNFGRTGVTDLSPLKDMKLTAVSFRDMAISDLAPLKGMPLTTLEFHCAPIADLSPAKDLKLTELDCSFSQVTDLSLLKGMLSMKRLYLFGTSISDLQPLEGMALEEIRLTPANFTQGLGILRDMTSLKFIGIDYENVWPAEEFWARYDNGEFKK